MGTQPFDKFINQKNNAAVKEKHKQEKKLAKKERAAAIEKFYEEKRQVKNQKMPAGEPARSHGGKHKIVQPNIANPESKSASQMPLNKYLAHCGVASRRNAIGIIISGNISVNGKTIIEPGFKVSSADKVSYNGKQLFVTKNLVYILLNKPKDYITTSDDPEERKTVLQLIQSATNERVYAVGRLDRNTSGVLLLTNDGDLTQKLTHPKFEVKKVYEVKLDKSLTKTDFEKIANGVKLEDGDIKPDAVAYADAKDKSIIGIELHSGRNRIVRRIFEHLGYKVKNLDRVMYANLTKKNVLRGKWRFLSEAEVRSLKYLMKSKSKS